MEFVVQMPQKEYDKCIEELKKGLVNYSYATRACEKVLEILTGGEYEEEKN